MNFVIPMAGRGERFVQAGYQQPKMLIEAHGKTLLQWSVDSLPLQLCTKLIFIGLREHEERHQISSKIKLLYQKISKIEFLFLDQPTRGQAETVVKAEPLFDLHQPLLIFNIDTFFQSKTLASQLLRTDVDGILGSFKDSSNRYSFAQVDPYHNVCRVAEKDPISDHALTGLYHFKRPTDFLRVARRAIENQEMQKGEFYVAPLYNKLIQEGMKFVLDFVQDHFILGTPEELDVFKRTFSENYGSE